MIVIKNPIAIRLIRNIILTSTFFSLIATGVQLYSEYKNETQLIDSQLEQVKNISLESLSNNLWQKNDTLINIQLKGLLYVNGISYVAIDENGKRSYSHGVDNTDDAIVKAYQVSHLYNNKTYDLGKLVIQVDLGQVREKVIDKFYLIAITQTIKTFIVSFIMLYIFTHMVTRHLNQIVEYAYGIINKTAEGPLQLDLKVEDDEIALLEETLNTLQSTMHSRIKKVEKEKEQLNHINSTLEKRIILQDNDSSSILVTEKEVQEIRAMLSLIQKDKTSDDRKRDIEALNVLFERTFRD